MKTIIQRVSDYAESIHQADYHDEGQHDAPHFDNCSAPICKGFADALVLTTDAIYHPPALSPFAIAHAAVTAENPTPEQWATFETLKLQDLSSHAKTGVDQRQGRK